MNVKILIVDDERDYSETMGFWLMAKGYDVSAVQSGMEAIDYLEKNDRPDIVFLDVNMPGIDGIETLTRIKKVHSGLPVVMVTAAASDERKEEAKRLGAAAFFSKEDDFSQAARLIKNALEKIKKLKDR